MGSNDMTKILSFPLLEFSSWNLECFVIESTKMNQIHASILHYGKGRKLSLFNQKKICKMDRGIFPQRSRWWGKSQMNLKSSILAFCWREKFTFKWNIEVTLFWFRLLILNKLMRPWLAFYAGISKRDI